MEEQICYLINYLIAPLAGKGAALLPPLPYFLREGGASPSCEAPGTGVNDKEGEEGSGRERDMDFLEGRVQVLTSPGRLSPSLPL